MKLILLLLITLVASVNSAGCIGVPLAVINGKQFNCRSLCCAPGYVQDLVTGTICVSCDSVGLFGCAECTLYATSDSGNNYTYRCLSSKNINGLITVGSGSLCTGPGQVADNTYVLNNWTNFDSCAPCSDIIPNAVTCKLASLCTITIYPDIGNGCQPRIKVLTCDNGFMPNNYSNACETCFDLIYGCTSCSNKNCTICDASLNLTVSSNRKSCVCINGTTCNLCSGNYEIWNGTAGACSCTIGYQNVSGACVLQQLCDDPNQIFNPIIVGCQCKKGYVSQDDVCVAVNCGDNSHISPSGVCVCDNSFTLVNSSCIWAGSYPSWSKNYFVEIDPITNISVTILTNYTCGCPAGFRMIKNVCMPCSRLFRECPCPEGWNMFNGTCTTCDELGITDCAACDDVLSDQNFTIKNWCTRCQPGFDLYQSIPGRISMCFKCRRGCSSCTENPVPLDPQARNYAEVCYQCKPASYYHQSGYCWTCNQKIPHCINCYHPNSTLVPNCLTCEAPFVLSADNKSCLCPVATTQEDSTCIPCHVGCMSCDSNYDCLQCWPGTILNYEGDCQCVSDSLSIDLYCDDCKVNLLGQSIQGCLYCATSTTCATCVENYVLYDGNCELCSRFILGCLTCSSSSICTSCDDYAGYELVGGSCVCKNGSYITINAICRNCTQLILGCNQCTSLNTCTACNESTFFHLVNNTCQCRDGFILVEDNCQYCDILIDGCAACNNITECRACKVGWVLTEDNRCHCDFDNGYVQIPGSCVLCGQAYSNCTKCDHTRCLDCDEFWDLNVTTDQCDIMIPCPIMACDACTEQRCIVCTPPAYLDITGTCRCPVYYKLDTMLGYCVPCAPNHLLTCKSCTISACQECTDSTMKRYNGDCFCLEGLYFEDSSLSCELCPPNCKECETITECTVCDENKKRELVDGVCECMEGYQSIYPNDRLQDNSICLPVP